MQNTSRNVAIALNMPKDHQRRWLRPPSLPGFPSAGRLARPATPRLQAGHAARWIPFAASALTAPPLTHPGPGKRQECHIVVAGTTTDSHRCRWQRHKIRFDWAARGTGGQSTARWGRVGEPACRPGSVRPLARGDGHPSGTAVADSLVRSTREPRAGRPRTLAQGTVVPLLDLAPGGVYQATAVTCGAGGLLHHRFTLTPARAGAV